MFLSWGRGDRRCGRGVRRATIHLPEAGSRCPDSLSGSPSCLLVRSVAVVWRDRVLFSSDPPTCPQPPEGGCLPVDVCSHADCREG